MSAKTPCFSTRSALPLVVVSLVPAFFAAIGIFAFPSADDFAYGHAGRAEGVWASLLQQYLSWSGRYASNFFLTILGKLNDSPWAYHLFPAFHIACLTWAVFSIVDACNAGARRSSWFVALCFVCAYLAGFVSPTQGLYWMAGSFTYQLSINALFGVVAIMLKVGVSGKSPGALGQVMLLALLALCLGGNEITAVSGFLIIAASAGAAFVTGHSRRGWFCMVALLALPFLLLSFLAPGSYSRADHQVVQSFAQKFGYAFPRALGGGFEAFKWLVLSPFIPMVLIIAPDLQPRWKDLPFSGWSPLRNFLALLLFGYGVFFITVFIACYSTGKPPYARINNAIFATCLLMGFVSIFIFHQHVSMFINRRIRSKVSPFALFLLFAVVLMAHKNISITLINLANGSLARYKNEMETRLSYVQTHKGDVELLSLSQRPFPVFFRDVDEEGKDWIMKSFQDYYGLEKVTMKKSGDV